MLSKTTSMQQTLINPWQLSLPFDLILFEEYICHHSWFPMSCVCKAWNDIIKKKIKKNKYCPHGYLPQISLLFDYLEILEFNNFKVICDANVLSYIQITNNDKLKIYTKLEELRKTHENIAYDNFDIDYDNAMFSRNREHKENDLKRYYTDELRYNEYKNCQSLDDILLHWCYKYGLINTFKFYTLRCINENKIDDNVYDNDVNSLGYLLIQHYNFNEYNALKLIARYRQLQLLLYTIDTVDYPFKCGYYYIPGPSISDLESVLGTLLFYDKIDIVKKIILTGSDNSDPYTFNHQLMEDILAVSINAIIKCNKKEQYNLLLDIISIYNDKYPSYNCINEIMNNAIKYNNIDIINWLMDDIRKPIIKFNSSNLNDVMKYNNRETMNLIFKIDHSCKLYIYELMVISPKWATFFHDNNYCIIDDKFIEWRIINRDYGCLEFCLSFVENKKPFGIAIGDLPTRFFDGIRKITTKTLFDRTLAYINLSYSNINELCDTDYISRSRFSDPYIRSKKEKLLTGRNRIDQIYIDKTKAYARVIHKFNNQIYEDTSDWLLRNYNIKISFNLMKKWLQ